MFALLIYRRSPDLAGRGREDERQVVGELAAFAREPGVLTSGGLDLSQPGVSVRMHDGGLRSGTAAGLDAGQVFGGFYVLAQRAEAVALAARVAAVSTVSGVEVRALAHLNPKTVPNRQPASSPE